VKAFLSERQDDWREGIAAAFRYFGGVPRTILGDYVTRHIIVFLCPLALCTRVQKSASRPTGLL